MKFFWYCCHKRLIFQNLVESVNVEVEVKGERVREVSHVVAVDGRKVALLCHAYEKIEKFG